MRLVKVILFLVINCLNFGIFQVALDYISPNFQEAFLIHKPYLQDNHLFKIGLVCHGLSACIALLICSFLVLIRIENKQPKFHRLLGKFALILIFFSVVPGGLILSYYAGGGVLGKLLFFLLSIYTAYVAFDAYHQAKKKQFKLHQLIMTELLLLLCSALILRILLLVLFYCSSLSWNTNYCIAIGISWLPTVIVFGRLKAKILSRQIDNENSVG